MAPSRGDDHKPERPLQPLYGRAQNIPIHHLIKGGVTPMEECRFCSPDAMGSIPIASTFN